MSFVLFAGCQYFGLMIGDRRSLSSKDGSITSENAEKVIRINNNVVVTAGGSEAVAYTIWKTVLNHPQRSSLSYEDCVALFRNKSDSIRDEYIKLSKSDNLNTNIGIMGLHEKSISLTNIDFLEDQIRISERSYANEDDNDFCFFATGLSGNLGRLFYDKFMKNPVFSITNIKSVFYQIIKQESRNDISINDNFIMEYITNDEKIKRDKIKIE